MIVCDCDCAIVQDCSDFDVSGMIRLLWQHGDSPLLPPALKDNITQALLHWQYVTS